MNAATGSNCVFSGCAIRAARGNEGEITVRTNDQLEVFGFQPRYLTRRLEGEHSRSLDCCTVAFVQITERAEK